MGISIRKFAKSCREFGHGVKGELTQLKGEMKQRRLERKAARRERREAARLRNARDRAWLDLGAQLNDEARKSEMYARIADASVANIGQARLHELHRKGIKTAYDVYSVGIHGLTNINSIGPGIATRLHEWSLSHEPAPVEIDLENPDHSYRFDVLTRAYLNRT